MKFAYHYERIAIFDTIWNWLMGEWHYSTKPIIKPNGTVKNLWEEQHGWGHNVFFSSWEHLRLCGHHPDRWSWQEGTEVRSKMESGKIARFMVVEFECATGVHDMFFATVKPLGYVGES